MWRVSPARLRHTSQLMHEDVRTEYRSDAVEDRIAANQIIEPGEEEVGLVVPRVGDGRDLAFGDAIEPLEQACGRLLRHGPERKQIAAFVVGFDRARGQVRWRW